MLENHFINPYVKAIFEIAQETNTTDVWLAELQLLSNLTQTADFIALVRNPAINIQTILNVLQETYTTMSSAILHLIQLLHKNKKLLFMPRIYTLYQQMLAASKNKATAIIQTTYPINPTEMAQIEMHLSKKTSKSITAVIQINPAIIGGIIISIDDQIIDHSITSSLNALTTQLIH